jgi:hypothetical protein
METTDARDVVEQILSMSELAERLRAVSKPFTTCAARAVARAASG